MSVRLLNADVALPILPILIRIQMWRLKSVSNNLGRYHMNAPVLMPIIWVTRGNLTFCHATNYNYYYFKNEDDDTMEILNCFNFSGLLLKSICDMSFQMSDIVCVFMCGTEKKENSKKWIIVSQHPEHRVIVEYRIALNALTFIIITVTNMLFK